jgi:flagellar hook-associated protein 2
MVSSVNNSTGTSIVSSLTNSTVDIGALAKNLVEANRAPRQAQIDERKTLADNKISSIGRIYSSTSQMKGSLAAFGDPKNLSLQPRSSDASKASFSFRPFYTPQAFDISMKVKQLASVNSVTLNGVSSSDTFPTSGKLEIFSGQRSSGSATAVASFDYEDYTSLEGLRDAINTDGNYSAAIMTSIVNGSSIRYLTITNGTGSDNNFYLSTTDSTDSSDLSSGVYVTAPTRDSSTQAITADPGQAGGLDAQVEVGGVTYSSPSNRFSSLVTGVNIELNSTASIDETIRLHTVQDMAKYKEIVTSIVANYNDLLATITEEIKYDKDIQKRGGLANDSVARGFISQLRKMTTETIATVSGKAVTFGQIGVKTNRDGKLELDSSRFDYVAELSPDIMEAVVASTSTNKGILERMNSITDVVLGRASDFVRMYDKTTNIELPKLADQKAKLDTEMDALHARYIKQFSAMQEVLKSTSSSKESLTSNMAAWTAGLKA